MRKILLIFISGILFLQCSTSTTIQKGQADACYPEIMVVAHRGAHQTFPENSISSIREAIEIGVDVIEIDIRHTKDNYLVLMHDKTIDRTTDGKGLVENYTLEEIKKFNLKNTDGTLSNEQIPTLEEVLKEFGGIAFFDLDMKTTQYLLVIEMVEKYDLLDSSLFLIYDLELAKKLKQRNGRFKILMRARDEESLPEICSSLNFEAIHIDFSFNTLLSNKMIKDNGSRSFINSLGKIDKEAQNHIDAFGKAYKNGANMIQTDYPELLLRYLRSNKLHN